MPNFKMCASSLCPKKSLCYRYKSIPDKNQSYSEFLDDTKIRPLCKDFIEILPNDKTSNS